MERWEGNRNRSLANKKGLKRFLGLPCRKCGNSWRYTQSGNCTECAKKWYKAKGTNGFIVEGHYFFGKPCKIHGDVGRYIKGRNCVKCVKMWAQAKRPLYDGKTKASLTFAARVKKWVTYKNVTGSIGLIAELNGVHPTTARKRFDSGLPLEKVFAPVKLIEREKKTPFGLTAAGRMFAAQKARWITFENVTGSIKLIVEMYGVVSYGTYNYRRQCGWSIAEALLVPKRQRRDNFYIKAQIQTALERRALREKQNDIRPVLQANLCIA